jgi:D-alanyl-D-alanine carboxypeptidase/D-alanyl-D-alanine-endopeptidase (penicillin-binding protein 4)
MEKILFLLSFLLFSSPCFSLGIENNFKQIIKKHHFSESTLGILVEDQGKNLVTINADKLMVPASLTKIVTAAGILTQYPMNKKFVTELWGKGQIVGEKLKGSLCLKGGGDPSFVSEKMWYLVNEFQRIGVKTIEGDLIIDAGRFDNESFDSGRDSVRVDRAFDAPISAMSFNWNSVNVYIRPNLEADKPAIVTLDPKNDYLFLDNKSKTVNGNSVKSISVTRTRENGIDKIIVTGNLSKNASEFVVYKSIFNPVEWTGSHLKEFLSQRGISYKGTVRYTSCEPESLLLASVTSKNLNEIVSDMLKFSNNFVAEMLVKNLAADNIATNPQSINASMKDGIERLKSYLDTLGIDRKSYVLENVSGLTRDNRFTAFQLAKVLNTVRDDFLIYPEFVSGLPIAGVDGTMKNRLKDGSGNWVRAKTGYLDGVIGLAGYVGRKDKPPYTFVFMFNGNYEQGQAARNLFDELTKEISKQ